MFDSQEQAVVIRFQICIFDILNTAPIPSSCGLCVVIRFQICIFDILNTAQIAKHYQRLSL